MSLQILAELHTSPKPPRVDMLCAVGSTSQAGSRSPLWLRPTCAFDALNSQFLVTQKQLHFEHLRDCPDYYTQSVCWSSGQRAALHDAWVQWMAPLHAWARQFCFLPGDYHDWNVRMSTHVHKIQDCACGPLSHENMSANHVEQLQWSCISFSATWT